MRLGAERRLGALGALAALALAGSLFLSWYVALYSTVSRTGGGFLMRFGERAADAWSAVPGTSVALAVCAVVVIASVGGGLAKRSRWAARVAIVAAVAAVALTVFRLIDGPAQHLVAQRGIEGAYVDRANGVPADRGVLVSVPLGRQGGVDAALGAALVALVAVTGLALWPRLVRPS